MDDRKLVLFEKRLGNYEVAGATYSFGDVIGFVDGEISGVLLVDTIGHNKSSGEFMTAFLREEIAKGWGSEKNIEEELMQLGAKLASFRKGKSRSESDRWHDSVSGVYCQLHPEAIYLSHTGGILDPFIRKKKYSERYVSFPFNCRGYLDDLRECSPSYKEILEQDDLLFLGSDGLQKNIAHSFWKEKKFSVFSRHSLELSELAVKNVLDGFYTGSPKVMRDEMVRVLKRYFLPKDRGDDDVTFAIVKKIFPTKN